MRTLVSVQSVLKLQNQIKLMVMTRFCHMLQYACACIGSIDQDA